MKLSCVNFLYNIFECICIRNDIFQFQKFFNHFSFLFILPQILHLENKKWWNFLSTHVDNYQLIVYNIDG